MKLKLTACPLLLTSLLLGCVTRLSVAKYDSSKTGVSYALPRMVIKVHAAYILKECFSQPKFDVKLSLEETFIADKDSIFVIDYEKLSSITKKTEFDIKFYENGAIKSLNADISDQANLILNKGVDFVASVAEAILAQGVFKKTEEYCTPEALADLKLYRAQKQLMTNNRETIESLTLELTELQAKYSEKYPVSDRRQQEIKNKKDALDTLSIALEKQSQTLEQITKRISVSKIYEFDFKEKAGLKDQRNFPSFTPEVDLFRKSGLLTALGVCTLYSDTSCEYSKEPKDGLVSNRFSVYGGLIFQGYVDSGAVEGFKPSGLVTRVPAPAEFKVCKNQMSENQHCSSANTLHTLKVSVSQAGYLSQLRLCNGPFESNALSVEFSPNGRILSLNYRTSTQLADTVEIGRKAVDAYIKLQKTRGDTSDLQ